MRVGEAIAPVQISATLLEGQASIEITIYDPEDELIGSASLAVPPSPVGTVAFPVPGTFADAGIHRCTARVVDALGASAYLPDTRFVVEAVVPAGLTLSAARSDWRDAPASDTTLWDLLFTAWDQVSGFAPEGTSRATLRAAQLAQARNIWRGQTVSAEGGAAEGDTFVITPVPLDWQIKARLRPPRPRDTAAKLSGRLPE